MHNLLIYRRLKNKICNKQPLKFVTMLNTRISIYDDYFATTSKVATLGEFLFDESIRQEVDAIRQIPDKDTRDEMKKKLPAATISGIFQGGHNGKSLAEHSGLICIDVDQKDNPDIDDWEEFKRRIQVLKCVAFVGLSVSGRGVFIIIRIPKCNAETHKQYYLALEDAFRKCGVKTDPNCKDITRLRGASYDDNYYYNPNATTFTKLPNPKPQPKPTATLRFDGNDDPQTTIGKVESCVNKVCDHQIDMTGSYNDWVEIGFSLADLGEQGRKYFHAVSQFYSSYDQNQCDHKFDELLRNRNGKIKIGTFFHICKDYGIIPTTPRREPTPTPKEDLNTIVALCPQHRLERLMATNPAVALLVDKLELVAVDDDCEPF